MTSTIFGARSIAQLEDNVKAAELALTEAQMKTLTEASDFELGYPYAFMKAPGLGSPPHRPRFTGPALFAPVVTFTHASSASTSPSAVAALPPRRTPATASARPFGAAAAATTPGLADVSAGRPIRCTSKSTACTASSMAEKRSTALPSRLTSQRDRAPSRHHQRLAQPHPAPARNAARGRRPSDAHALREIARTSTSTSCVSGSKASASLESPEGDRPAPTSKAG
ncbi:MAG: aldo/keto reductase [Deltaproteobacteria bacterium]|nr:aldo/keto reductase [Deltaproteobacteria bacterium]